MNGICVVLSLSFGAIVAIIRWSQWALTNSPFARSVQICTLERLMHVRDLSGNELSSHLHSSAAKDDYVLYNVIPINIVVLRMFKLGWLSATPVKGAETQMRVLTNSRFQITPAGLERLDRLVLVT